MYEMNLMLYITNLSVTVLCGALLAVVPALTRKSLLFGVQVPESAQKHPAALALKRRYVLVLLLTSAAILGLETLQYLFWPDITLLATLYFPLPLAAAQFCVYLPSWRAAGRLKAENGWRTASLAFSETCSSQARGRLSRLPWGWYVAGALIALATAVASLWMYPSLPDRIPTHYDIRMQPDAWADKSAATALAMPLVALGMNMLMLLCAFTIEKAKLQISPSDPALSFAQHRVYRRRMGNALGAMSLLVVLLMADIGRLPLWPDVPGMLWPLTALMGLSLAWLLYTSVRCGQGGCRLKPAVTQADRLATGYRPAAGADPLPPGRYEDERWFLGMFYHNPDDPSLLVEDRFGGNIGFNYARPAAKAIVAALALVLAGVYVFCTLFLPGMTR